MISESFGFTMIELLVTVGIFSLISTAILVNYPKFSSRIVLENVAHQVGLSIRQAQSYGLNVQGIEYGGGINQFPTYGVHFSLSGINETDPTGPKKFLLFADILPDNQNPTENNKRYDAQSDCSVTGGECVELFSIQSVNNIYMLCGDLKTNGATIDSWEGTGADCSLSALDIGYTRPDPDATISGYSELDEEWKTFSDGVVIVRSPKGETREVVVWTTGQIAIE